MTKNLHYDLGDLWIALALDRNTTKVIARVFIYMLGKILIGSEKLKNGTFFTPETIATELSLSLDECRAAIDYLKEHGIFEVTDEKLESGEQLCYLGHSSKWLLSNLGPNIRANPEEIHHKIAINVPAEDMEEFIKIVKELTGEPVKLPRHRKDNVM